MKIRSFVGVCLCGLLLSVIPVVGQSSEQLLASLRNYLLETNAMEADLHIRAQMDGKIELFNDPVKLTLQQGNYRLEGEYFVFYADSSSVWLYDPSSEELTVTDRVTDYTNFLENPFAILQEDALLYFEVASPQTRLLNGETVRVLTLTSKYEQPAWVIEIAVGPESNRLRYLNCVRDREHYRIEVLSLQKRSALPQEFFTPDAALQQRVELVDLR